MVIYASRLLVGLIPLDLLKLFDKLLKRRSKRDRREREICAHKWGLTVALSVFQSRTCDFNLIVPLRSFHPNTL